MVTEIFSGFCESLQENAVKILAPSDPKHHEEAFFSSLLSSSLSYSSLAYFPYIEKIKACLCDQHVLCVSSPINF
jgi:hypothetical protein